MTTANENLSDNDQERMDSILIAFDTDWSEDALAARTKDLPPMATSQRQTLLIELIKIDLERQWQHGRRVMLEEYLKLFPELGNRETVPATLILAEFEARNLWEARSDLSTFAVRFPALIGALQQRVREQGGQTPARQTEPAELPTPAIPGYEILGVLGKGGMGVVYKARQHKLGRLVALKMILHGRHAGAEELARFHKEMESAARLQHPGIVQIYEVGEHEGLPYCVLEYCPGGSLAQRLRKSTLAPITAGALVEQLAHAIQQAHQHNIVHRDLKPDNVLFVEDSDKPLEQTRAKITDFGLAKEMDVGTQYTQTGVILGTPGYMAPEQASGRGKTLSPATDVYALGAILYECLTGRPPFKGTTVPETVLQVLHDEPVPPRQIRFDIPRDLETICLKCLQKEPGKRYRSAAELAADLGRWREGLPIMARRVGSAERLWRWCRRHPALAVLSSVVLLLLTMVAIISSFSALWIRHEQIETLTQLGKTQEAQAKADRATADVKKQLKQKKRQLFHSKIARARAVRLTRLAGQRFDSLRLLQEAMAMTPELELTSHEQLKLRNEYIACSALPADLRVVEEMLTGRPIYVPPLFNHYLRRDDKGDVWLHRRNDKKKLRRLACGDHVKNKEFYWGYRFSPNGRYVALRYTGNFGPAYCLVWDLKNGQLKLKKKMPDGCFGVDFFPDNERLAYVSKDDNRIQCIKLKTGVHLPSLGNLPAPAHRLLICPRGKRIAVTARSRVYILDSLNGKQLKTFSVGGNSGLGSWSANGEFLLVTNGRDLHVFDAKTWKRKKVINAHNNVGLMASFSPTADLLVSKAWDTTTRLWHPFTGQELVRAESDRPGHQFSADGRFISFLSSDTGHGGLWEVATSRILHQIPVAIPQERLRISVALHPQGRLLACASEHRIHLCDAASGRQIAILDVGDCRRVRFDPMDGSLISVGTAGLYRWPIYGNPRSGTVSLGACELLIGNVRDTEAKFALTPNGHYLAFVGGHNGKTVYVIDRTKSQVIFKGAHHGATRVAISKDGKWLATSVRNISREPGLRIWDIKGRKLVAKNLWPGRKRVHACFSPDGKWLAGSVLGEIRIWRTGSWNLVHSIREKKYTLPLALLQFSPDSRILVHSGSQHTLRLLSCGAWNELATLTAPHPRMSVGELVFSADGTQLAKAGDPLYVWDLRQIRRELQEAGLDWNAPPYPPAQIEHKQSQPLRILDVAFYMDYFRARRLGPNSKAVQDLLKKSFNPNSKRIDGTLTEKDPHDRIRKNCRHRVHTFRLVAGNRYLIELSSKEFDTFLRLEDATKKTLASNDDIDYPRKNLNSRLILTPSQSGEYRIIVTSYQPAAGDYSLSVRSGQSNVSDENGE